MIKRADIKNLVGIPWRVGGRDLRGADCLGIVLMALEALRPDLPIMDPWTHLKALWKAGWRQVEYAFPDGWKEVDRKAMLRPADVLFLHGPDGPNHLGIALDKNRVLHSTYNLGSVITPANKMRRQIIKIFRPPAVMS